MPHSRAFMVRLMAGGDMGTGVRWGDTLSSICHRTPPGSCAPTGIPAHSGELAAFVATAAKACAVFARKFVGAFS